ncbi:hypothetical protein [Fischerella sp. PCC 9605]|uniref:hypothetical protein n=1 Tax=Fischerella sp. PCC 9605 TaxID=1173024 RepID=UPI00047EBD4A|nr:hypothetical protein [Fischerella sp. PCC 9605]
MQNIFRTLTAREMAIICISTNIPWQEIVIRCVDEEGKLDLNMARGYLQAKLEDRSYDTSKTTTR